MSGVGGGETRPWGSYLVLADEPTHKVKRIEVRPGRRLSYQFHEHRAEHWFVLEGEGTVTLDGTELPVGRGDTVDVGLGMPHRIENRGGEPLVFIEVQHGTSFEEDDIVRLEDDYGRA
jgi:mannose-6-phosphate isomerase-like protein (cupin superfamily)